MSKSIKYPLTVTRTGEYPTIGVIPDYDDFDEHYVSLSGFTGIHKPELFAAAPELYEALDMQIRNCPVCKGEGVAIDALDLLSDKHPEKIPCRRCSDGRAALAKARGEK